MGNVAISIKIMPTSPETDVNKIVSDIKKKMEVQDYKIEPLAFGLKCLRIMIIRPDKQGANTDEMENIINKIDGVETLEVENVTLV